MDLIEMKKTVKRNVIIGGVMFLVSAFSAAGYIITTEWIYLAIAVVALVMAAWTFIRLKRTMKKVIEDTLKQVEKMRD